MKRSISIALLLLILILSFSYQVQSALIPTGSYYLRGGPVTPYTFYINKYSNGTHYAVNGTNWEDFLRSDNASYISLMCLGNMTTGGILHYGANCFDFDTPLEVTNEGVYIEGESLGYDTIGTVFNFTGTNGALFNFTHDNTHKYFGGIKDAEIKGNDGAGTIGIHINQFYSDLTFENLYIRDFAKAGIQIDGGASGNGANVESKVWNIEIRYNFIEENDAGLGYGIYLTDTDSRNHSISRVDIYRNHFYGNNNSIYSDSSWIFNLDITHNTIDQEEQEAICLLGGRGVIIESNRIYDIGTDALNTHSAIYISNESSSFPTMITITNNRIGNHWNQNQSKYLVELQGSCDHIRVENNIFESDKTASPTVACLDNSTESDIKIRYNQGYVTEYSNSALNATTNTWTFTTDLEEDPVRCYASFDKFQVTNYYWSYSAPTLTITFSVTLNQNTTCYAVAYCWDE